MWSPLFMRLGQSLMTPLLHLGVFSGPKLTKEWDDQRGSVALPLCVWIEMIDRWMLFCFGHA